MKTNKYIGRLMRSTMLAGFAATVAAPAFAQETDDVASDDVIVVTGSRLKDANVGSTSPVTTIGSEAFDIRGTTDVVDLLNTLPQIITTGGSQNTGFANGANGTSTVNLRGLGATRTLVLVDGKRLPYGSPTAGGFASDINLVPAQLVERVEITTGGGSAVYGSDAIAGVANFILKKDFEGFEIDGLFGFAQSGNGSELAQSLISDAGFDPVTGSVTDNETFDISGIMGANIDGGRGNVTAYFRYLHSNGTLMGNRDFSQVALFGFGPTNADVVGFGSNQGPFPTTFNVGAILDGSDNPIPLVDAGGNTLLNSAGDPLVSGAFSLNPDGSGFTDGFNNAFNFNPLNPLRRAVERFNAGFSGNYDITDNVNAYMSFGFTQSNSPQQIAPSAAFGSSINRVNCDNPLLSAELLARICGTDTGGGVFSRDIADGTTDGFAPAEIRRRFVEGGPRTDDRTLTNFRIVGGFTGTTFDEWEWDVFGQFASTSLQRLQFNQVTSTNVSKALDIVDDGSGNPVCRSFLDGSDTNCIPFVTAFDPNATFDPALQQYLDTPSLTNGNIQQTVFGGTIQNNLERYGMKSPFAENAATILFGVEYRRDQLSTQGDATNAQGLLIGAGGVINPTNGKTEVWELFMETAIPLIEGMEYIEELSITGAYRYSNYNSRNIRDNITGGNFSNSTFAAGLSWTPTEDIRLRGQYQRAIRAPNVGNLFLPQNGGLVTLNDPCAGIAGTPPPGQVPTATAAQCANTGLPTTLFGLVPPDSGQLNVLTGGNPDLTPETANTWTVGAIITPRQVEGLTVSIDYFNIALKDVIGNIPTSFTLNTCLQTGDPQFCGLINRGTDGSLTQLPRTSNNIVATSQNIAAANTRGIDGRVTYSYDFDKWGSFNWDYNASYYLASTTLPVPGQGEFDCAGLYNASCGNPTSEYRHSLTTTYTTNYNVQLSVVWRYLSGVDRVASVDGPTGAITLDPDSIAARIPAYNYFDVAAFWDVAENVRLRAGVNNLLDKDPPFVPAFALVGPTGNSSGNTYPGNYDVIGRFIFVGANVRF
jgi:iron complex outermembrane recepter protein